MAYPDDVMKGNKDVSGAQAGNIKLEAMLKDTHPDKTCFIVCGNKRFEDENKNAGDLLITTLMQ